MLIPEKKEFMEEIMKIQNVELKNKLEKLYDHLKGYKKINAANDLVKEVLLELFPNNFTQDNLIPLEFHYSIIGKVLFSIMYSSDEMVYTVKDLIELTKSLDKPEGFTKQFLSQEIKDGNLKGTKINNRWTFTQKEVNEYLILKGIKR